MTARILIKSNISTNKLILGETPRPFFLRKKAKEIAWDILCLYRANLISFTPHRAFALAGIDHCFDWEVTICVCHHHLNSMSTLLFHPRPPQTNAPNTWRDSSGHKAFVWAQTMKTCGFCAKLCFVFFPNYFNKYPARVFYKGKLFQNLYKTRI